MTATACWLPLPAGLTQPARSPTHPSAPPSLFLHRARWQGTDRYECNMCGLQRTEADFMAELQAAP